MLSIVVVFVRLVGMIFGRNGWRASRNAWPGRISAWVLVKDSGSRREWGRVEVGGQQHDEEERRRGVDHHQQSYDMAVIVATTRLVHRHLI